MAMVEIEKESYDMEPSLGRDSEYPWGTRLELEGDIVDKLGLDKFETGTSLNIKAVAMVSRKAEESDEGKIDKRVCLQITKLGVAGKVSPDRAEQLYNEGD